LSAAPRTEFGKGAARRARRDGLVPAVLYGHGTEPRHLSLPARDFSHIIKSGPNTVITLDLAGGEELALAKSVVRHPLRDYVEHVDLLLVRRGEKVTVDVPVHVSGEAAPGSLVLVDLNAVAIEVDALSIPEHIAVDVSGAEVGTQVLAGQLAIPDGATLVTDPEALVVAVQVAEAAEVPEEAVEVEAEAAGAAGAEAATAPADTGSESSEEG
jgi:large subunit ribosomal protein L25